MANVTIVPPTKLGETETVHIVYVHGFRGDHTTFQAFPSDLHNHLLPDIPGLQTWVYPTYKSAKPLSFAVANFLGWLSSLPPGPVILAGHSMGGLLVAEAAINPSPVARRITGVLAFDTPYLGMHPHVVVSGIASLFQKKEDENSKPQRNEQENGKALSENPGPPAASAEGMSSEKAINDEGIVNFVTAADAYPRPGMGSSGGGSPTSVISNPQNDHGGRLSPPPPSKSLVSAVPSSAQSGTSAAGSSLLTTALSFFTTNADDPFIRFLNKHSNAPVAAVSRWVVEYFEFGFAMFDYPGLLERYEKLENWDGDWVCFWTITGGEAIAEDAGMDEGDRPPTPLKVQRRKSPGLLLENEFENAMRAAAEKEERRQMREAEKRSKLEEKERSEREKARRKEEEVQEKQRRKEEAAQEKERIKAADLVEKERKRAADALEKERRTKKVAEQKEKARIEKEEERQARKHAKPVKKRAPPEDEAERHSHESERPATMLTPSNPLPPPANKETHDDPLPEVVVETIDNPSTKNVELVDERSDKDNYSVTGSFQTAQETHNADSTAPSPARSLAALPTPAHSRPPSPARASAHHFITLPGALHPRRKRHWLKVRIAGVEDEVAAHCGLFIRAQNLEYDRFVERVVNVVKSWVL